MDPSVLLLLSLGLPLAGAAAIWIVAPLGVRFVRWTALAATLLTLACAIGVTTTVLQAPVTWPHIERTWLTPAAGSIWDIRLALGLDGISLWLYGLTTLLMLTSVLVSWRAVDRDEGLFYGLLLLLEAGCLGVFCAQDVVLFYISFEFTLIPLYFLIGIWGSEARRLAARKFFLYTLAGSLLTFVSILTLVGWSYHTTSVATFSIDGLRQILEVHPMPVAWQMVVFWGLFAGFAIKVPLFPFHTWLPLAHVQAPAAGSIFLAGILLKMGTYGFLRFSLPMLPAATAAAAPVLVFLAVAGIIYGALVALAQTDIKRLIAYSSVSHMGYCVLGLFVLNSVGVRGGLLQMLSHGISTGALFALVGMLYERYHTRDIGAFRGLARQLPWFSCFFVLFTLSSIGLPGLNGFAGEFMVLIGTFQHAWSESLADHLTWMRWLAVVAVAGVVLGAWYMLWLVRRLLFGPWRAPHVDEHGAAAIRDLDLRERLALAPLAVFVFWIGLWPQYFTGPMSESIDQAFRAAAMTAAHPTQPSPIAQTTPNP